MSIGTVDTAQSCSRAPQKIAKEVATHAASYVMAVLQPHTPLVQLEW